MHTCAPNRRKSPTGAVGCARRGRNDAPQTRCRPRRQRASHNTVVKRGASDGRRRVSPSPSPSPSSPDPSRSVRGVSRLRGPRPVPRLQPPRSVARRGGAAPPDRDAHREPAAAAPARCWGDAQPAHRASRCVPGGGPARCVPGLALLLRLLLLVPVQMLRPSNAAAVAMAATRVARIAAGLPIITATHD